MKEFKHPSKLVPVSHNEYVNIINKEKFEDFIERMLADETRFIPKYLFPDLPVIERKNGAAYHRKGDFKLHGEQETLNNYRIRQFELDVEIYNVNKPVLDKSDLNDYYELITLSDSLPEGGIELLQWLTLNTYQLEVKIHEDTRIVLPVEVLSLMRRLEYPFLDSTMHILLQRLIDNNRVKTVEGEEEETESIINSSDEYGSSYEKYSGSYASDYAGYSDDAIDDAFEGDPDNYWNID